MSYSSQDYEAVLKAIDEGLFFSDERDEDDFFILVDEDRNIRDYKPDKSLIEEMESLSLIYAIEKETKREYIKFEGEKRPFPLMSIYGISDKGRSLISND